MKSLAASPPQPPTPHACLSSTSHSVFLILSYISDTGVISPIPCQPGHPSVDSSAATQLWRELVVNTSVAFCIGKVWCHRAGTAAPVIGFHAQHRRSLTARNGLWVPLGITWPSTASKENILKTYWNVTNKQPLLNFLKRSQVVFFFFFLSALAMVIILKIDAQEKQGSASPTIINFTNVADFDCIFFLYSAFQPVFILPPPAITLPPCSFLLHDRWHLHSSVFMPGKKDECFFSLTRCAVSDSSVPALCPVSSLPSVEYWRVHRACE